MPDGVGESCQEVRGENSRCVLLNIKTPRTLSSVLSGSCATRQSNRSQLEEEQGPTRFEPKAPVIEDKLTASAERAIDSTLYLSAAWGCMWTEQRRGGQSVITQSLARSRKCASLHLMACADH